MKKNIEEEEDSITFAACLERRIYTKPQYFVQQTL